MKWRAHRDKDGKVDQLVVISDTHTILRVLPSLFICFRKAKPQAVIIGRWSTAALARACCESDNEGKPYPPDTVDTYPAEKPTLDSQEGSGEAPQGTGPTEPVP